MTMSVGSHNVTCTGSALKDPKPPSEDPVVEVYFYDYEEQESITAWLYTTEKAFPFTESKLAALGWDPRANDYQFGQLNLEGDDNPLKGVKTTIVVKENEWNGKITHKVDSIGGVAFMDRMDESQASLFAAKLRAKVIARKGAAGVSVSAPKKRVQKDVLPAPPPGGFPENDDTFPV